MADEFAKGFGVLTTAGLGWMVLAGWYNTAGFEDTQLFAPNPEQVDLYGQLGLLLKEALFYFAIFGAITFWVIIPALNEAREAWSNRS
jgi:hypothetical protein